MIDKTILSKIKAGKSLLWLQGFGALKSSKGQEGEDGWKPETNPGWLPKKQENRWESWQLPFTYSRYLMLIQDKFECPTEGGAIKICTEGQGGKDNARGNPDWGG